MSKDGQRQGVHSKNQTAPLGFPAAAIFAALFLLAMAGAALACKLPWYAAILYWVASAVAFAAYAIDKSAAQSGRRRIRESTLHLFALVGGWPGALIARKVCRHKSRKRPFRTIFWFTVAANLGVLSLCLLPAVGSATAFLPGFTIKG